MDHDSNRLRCDHVLATPIDYDWTAPIADPDDRPWEWAETVTCDKCGSTVVAVNGQIEEHTYIVAGTEGSDEPQYDDCMASGDYHDSAEGPMMSYWYPVTFPGDLSDAARLISDLPLCAVTVDGKEGLALTGGGMDLSWEICEAYTRLACLPPYYFASDLPQMGLPLDARRLAILDACDRSIEIIATWTTNAGERMVNLRKAMSENLRGMGPANMDGIPSGELEIARLLAIGVPLGMAEERIIDVSGVKS